MAEAQAVTLWDVLGQVPDHRSRPGRCFSLRSVPAIALAALLAGRKNLAGIARTGSTAPPLRLLRDTPLQGGIVSTDAVFTDRGLCRRVIQSKSDYVLPVKDTQRRLEEQIQTAFAEPSPPWQMRTRRPEVDRAESVAKGHGRIEGRAHVIHPIRHGTVG